MTQARWTCRLGELPDPAYPPYRLRAGGDVLEAIGAAGEHLLRALAQFPPDSATISIRLDYRPGPAGGDRQGRLTVTVSAEAHAAAVAAALAVLIGHCPLWRFYAPHWREDGGDPQGGMQIPSARVEVARRQMVLPASVTPEFNAKVPPVYWTLQPFQPRDDNDYLLLDAVLDGIDEPVVIEVSAAAASVADLLTRHTRYLSMLQQINRTWDADEDEGASGRWRAGDQEWGSALKPLRRRDPLADDILRRQQRFHETLMQPHLRFRVRVAAGSPATARLVASVLAESALAEGSYALIELPAGGTDRRDPLLRPCVEGAQILGEEGSRLYEELLPLAFLAPVEELTSLLRLPVASADSPRCIRKNTDPRGEDPEELIVLGSDQQADGQPRGIRLGRLPKHLLITGVPGGGKSVTVAGICLQLARRDIPLVIFEPGKSEYRRLKALKGHHDKQLAAIAEDIRIYTPGDECLSAMRINPLKIPEGVGRDEHIEHVARCFQAAMPMGGPLLGILGEALERVYEAYPHDELPPRMADLHAAAREVLDEKGYSGDVDSDLRAALDVRLGALTRRSIGRVFQCRQENPTARQLATGRTIVELARPAQDQACLLMLFVLLKIWQYVRHTPWSGRGVRLVVIVEEAHNLIARSTEARASEANADPKAFATEFVCRLLAELRALGVGIVIVDQLPSAIAPEAIKHPGSQLAFRQLDAEDRGLLAAAMLLGPIEQEEIARLRPGEAYFFTEGYFGPRRIRTPNLEEQLGLAMPPSDAQLADLLRREPWFREAQQQRVFAELQQLRRGMDRFDGSRGRLIAQAARLVAARSGAIAIGSASTRQQAAGRLAGRARDLRARLDRDLRAFRRDVYRPLMGEGDGGEIPDEALQAIRRGLAARFESVIQAGVGCCEDVLDRLIRDGAGDAPQRQGD